MGCTCSSDCCEDAAGTQQIRITSYILAFVSVVALILILPVYFFYTSSHFGNIGCEVLLFVAAIIGIFCKSRLMMSLCLLIAAAGFCWNCVSVAIDPYLSTTYFGNSICTDQTGATFYGPDKSDTSMQSNIDNCQYKVHQCTCMSASDTKTCYFFDGQSDCNKFFLIFLPLYKAVAALEVITCAIGLVLCIILLISFTCPTHLPMHKDGAYTPFARGSYTSTATKSDP